MAFYYPQHKVHLCNDRAVLHPRVADCPPVPFGNKMNGSILYMETVLMTNKEGNIAAALESSDETWSWFYRSSLL